MSYEDQDVLRTVWEGDVGAVLSASVPVYYFREIVALPVRWSL